MKKYHYVYETVNLENGKFYLGVHSTDNLDDGYLGSGKQLLAAIKKYGRHNFYTLVVAYFKTREEALAFETKLVDQKMISNPDCYNVRIGGAALEPNRSNASEARVRKLVSEKTKEAMARPEVRLRVSLAQKNRFAREEVLVEHRIRTKAALNTPEAKKKLSRAAFNRWADPEYRSKMLIIRRKQGEERRRKSYGFCGDVSQTN